MIAFVLVQGAYVQDLVKEKAGLSGEIIITGRERVVDVSQGAAAKGVMPGMSLAHARRICPGAFVFQLEGCQSVALQGRLQEFYSHFTPFLEPYSSREFFLDLGGGSGTMDVAARILKKLVPFFGYRAVLGLASSKLLARAIVLAAGDPRVIKCLKTISLPQGFIFHLETGREEECRQWLPLETLWTMEAGLLEHLTKLGLKTWGEAARVPPERLKSQMGQEAYLFREFCLGRQSPGLVIPPQEIWELALSLEEGIISIAPYLDRLAEELDSFLEKRHLGCLELSLWAVRGKGVEICQKRFFPEPRQGIKLIRTQLELLWEKMPEGLLPQEIKVRAVGLRPLRVEQLRLFNFSLEDRVRKKKLEELLFRLQKDYPARVLGLAKNLGISRREAMLAFYDPWRLSF